jgi:hypothetical protein
MPHAIIRRRKNERASERKIKKKKIRRGDSIIGARTKGLVRALIEARSYIYCNYVRVRGIYVEQTLVACTPLWWHFLFTNYSIILHFRRVFVGCYSNFLASRCHYFCAQGVAS